MRERFSRRGVVGRFLAVVAAVAMARSAGATWSIVAVDTRTGEVAVGSATCLINTDLTELVPCVAVGAGAGAAQSVVEAQARNRMIMFADFMAGLSSETILEDIALNGAPGLQTRQFGIVAMTGDPVTFTGTQAGAWAGGLTGRVGTIKYAIQGNLLTGDAVVLRAEQAFVGTRGDLSQRLMAAMEAARNAGGDGRCSCRPTDPTSCGNPPPEFAKSSHTGFVIVARVGDTDGTCGPPQGCATGDYYLRRSRRTGVRAADPVKRLRQAYDAWRAGLLGRPDHLLSTVEASAQAVPADGRTRASFTVRLVDVDGVPLPGGGASVQVRAASSLVGVGPVSDHGDGTYGFTATAGTTVGTEEFVITADDGTVEATLYPYPELRVDPVGELHAGRSSLPVTAGGEVPFVLNAPAFADRPYVLLASASGTVPGQPYDGLTVPLNSDGVFLATLAGAGGALLPGTLGVLDGTGRAEASFVAPPGLLLSFVDGRFDWAAVFFGPRPGVTAPVGFDLEP